jgi:hypothetical protein
MVENLPQQMAYQHGGRLLGPEEESSLTVAHDTQLTDLTTEETAASTELANSIQTGKTYANHTISTGVGRADRLLTERVKLKAGDKGKEIPLRACTIKAGDGRDTSPQWQPDRQADTEESNLSNIPEWILDDSLHLNRNITPPAEQVIRNQGNKMMRTAGWRR